MWNIANSLHEETVKEILEHALRQRGDITIDSKKDEAIVMSDYWKSELKQLPMQAHVSIQLQNLTSIFRNVVGWLLF